MVYYSTCLGIGIISSSCYSLIYLKQAQHDFIWLLRGLKRNYHLTGFGKYLTTLHKSRLLCHGSGLLFGTHLSCCTLNREKIQHTVYDIIHTDMNNISQWWSQRLTCLYIEILGQDVKGEDATTYETCPQHMPVSRGAELIICIVGLVYGYPNRKSTPKRVV